jgi:hypothetical protein
MTYSIGEVSKSQRAKLDALHQTEEEQAVLTHLEEHTEDLPYLLQLMDLWTEDGEVDLPWFSDQVMWEYQTAQQVIQGMNLDRKIAFAQELIRTLTEDGMNFRIEEKEDLAQFLWDGTRDLLLT